jgi:hypothetical protein
MAVNLIRNARVFISSFVDSTTGVLTTTGGMTNANTFEIQVLDGMTFSQETNTETVTINESGDSPNRGQQGFNTSLNPVSFSFSTYLKPAQDGTTNTAEEAPLWNALTSADTITTASSGWQDGTDPNPATVVLTGSDKNQLQKFALIIAMDNQTFIIENCALNEATIDFGLDGIATVAWSGQATSITRTAALTIADPVAGAEALTGGGLTGSNAAKPRITTNCYYLANKLSTVAITYGGTTYNLAITGGSITYSNNITYLTPANIGVVNKPFTYFTGTRAISGNFSAYLRTGSSSTGGLFDALNTASATTDQPVGTLAMNIGGSASATARVSLEASNVMLTLPAVNTDQVVGMTINFTCMGTDLDTANEVTLNYYAPA